MLSVIGDPPPPPPPSPPLAVTPLTAETFIGAPGQFDAAGTVVESDAPDRSEATKKSVSAMIQHPDVYPPPAVKPKRVSMVPLCWVSRVPDFGLKVWSPRSTLT